MRISLTLPSSLPVPSSVALKVRPAKTGEGSQRLTNGNADAELNFAAVGVSTAYPFHGRVPG